MLRWVFGADDGPFRSSLNGMRQEVSGFAATAKGQLAGILAGGALLGAISQVIDKFARLKDIADRFGASAEAIQRVGYVAEQSGMDLESMAKAMTLVTKNAADAAINGGDMAKAFEVLGINASEFANLQMDEQLLKLNEGYNASSKGALELGAVMKIMGKSGGEAIPTLTQSTEDFTKSMAAANVVSNEQVANIAAIDDAIADFTNDLYAIGGKLVGSFGPFVSMIRNDLISAFDVLMSSLETLGEKSVVVGSMIGEALVGNFKKAGEEYDRLVALTVAGDKKISDIIAKNASKTNEIWGGKKEPVDPEVKKAKDKALSDAANDEKMAPVMEKRKKLAEEIAKLEEDSKFRSLSLSEKILDAEKRRAQLGADSLFGDDETKMLEARKQELEIAKELEGLRADKDSEEKQTAEKAIDLMDEQDKLTQELEASDRDNKLASLNDQDRKKMLMNERDVAYQEQSLAKKRSDTKGILEAGIKASELTGEIDEITRKADKDLQVELESVRKENPSIITDSLADVGGGSGGVFVNQNDQAKRMLTILEQIAANTAGGDQGSRPPEPI